ncbi:TPA: hypothetical protein VDV51_005808, partial [Pseudomonas aeruginosa]|nr:hypothetical protein [Pseudomonas aeruginosa]
KTKKILFVENLSDARTIFNIARKLGFNIENKIVIWPWASKGHERKHLFNQLLLEIPELKGISLNDRDNEEINTVIAENLRDTTYPTPNAQTRLYFKKWRRRYIEGYFLHPDPIARAANRPADEVIRHVLDNF